MLLSCQNISKSFIEKIIIQNVSFHIEDNDKVAIVGINGAGKTTLLNIITGELSPDNGQMVIARDKSLGYLKQNQAVSSENNIYDELLSVKSYVIQLEKLIRETELKINDASGTDLEQLLNTYTRLTHEFEVYGGYTYRSEVTGVLKGLGFTEDEFDKSIATLSGGQKTRVALGKLLLTKPDLILLDEPTNHLDISAVNWLETYLQNYKGAVIIVSHDRYFLDRIANKVVEISNTKASLFVGNYTVYAVKKEKLRADAMKAYLNQSKEIERQEAVITKLRQFNREKHIKRARSREKLLAKVERIDKPIDENDEIHFELKPAIISGKDVLEIVGLTKSFYISKTDPVGVTAPGRPLPLFSDVNISIKRGEHIAIIGDNGTGKTTFLKILNNVLEADCGSFTYGTNVHIGYYDQDQHVLNEENTLIMEISDAHPDMSDTEIRNMLAAFLFTGDDVFKRIGDLSGGERGRVALAKLMLSQANFLILDEPTNHLDITSKEILEAALNRYTGTVLYVSHDRYFINRTASRILDLCNGAFIDYPGYGNKTGNYDYYLEKSQERMSDEPCRGDRPRSPATSNAKVDYLSRKEKQANERKRENTIRRLEEKISSVELKLKTIEEKMLAPEVAINAEELLRLTGEKDMVEGELIGLLEEWEMFNEE